MKVGKRVSLVLGASVLLPLLSVIASGMIVSAQDSTLEYRLQQRKNTLKTRLTAAQQVRLRARCQGAQALVTALNARVEAVQKKRVNAHDRIRDHLAVLQAKLGDAADTTKLQAAIASVKEKTDLVEVKLTAYSQALSDLQQMDCASDPTGFKASLDEARSLRIELVQSTGEVRKHIHDILKPELKALKQSLKSQNGEVIN